MATECIFCSIIAGTIPSTRIAETDDIIVIKDIAPKAPIHYLIIPKKHIKDIRSFVPEDKKLASELLMMAQRLSKDLPDPQAFKLVVSNGAQAGQVVFHLHIHFLAGSTLPHLF